MTGPEFEKAIVALACYQIGHKELYRGMSAVAMMLQNRAAAVGDSLYGTAVKTLYRENPSEFPDSRDPEFHKLLQAIEAEFEGNLVDKTGGAKYFLPTSAIDEDFKEPPSYVVGQLHFYRCR